MEGEQGSGLKFQLSADGNRLQAIYTPDGPVVPVGFAWLKVTLDAQRAATGLFIYENASAELKRLYNAATGPFTLDIGERRNGAFSVNMAQDLMSATLNISPPYGGKPATVDDILNHLREKGITFGILTPVIREAIVANREKIDLEIAVGRKPVPGEPGQLLSLIPEAKERVPVADDQDVVDYREISDLVSVKAGTPLMRRIPPTKGEAGEDIMGVAIPAEDGQDRQFAPDLTGVLPDPNDSDLLVAAIAGMPVLVANGVIVEPLIKVKNVDLSTGNLHFEGAVEVSGDVKAGMEVNVAGNLTVGGVIEAARVNCGGDILVKGGVICHKEHDGKEGESAAERTYVKARGSMSVLFAENACLVANDDIMIRELSMQSDLTAGGRIIIGEEGSKKGHLIGGVCRAGSMVKAVVVGSRAGVQTRIEVGVDPTASERLDSVSRHLQAKEKELEEVDKDLAYCRDNPDRVEPERCQHLKAIHDKLQAELAELTGNKKRLQKTLEPSADSCVEVEREIYYGVVVKIGDRQCQLDDDQSGGSFRRIVDAVFFFPRS